MKNPTLRIATRQSQLALWQANSVKQRLQTLHPNLDIKLIGLTTAGDKYLSGPLSNLGGKGLFVKELEQALLDNRADIAVHSMKDVPMTFPHGLGIAAICEREDPRDVFVSNTYATLAELPEDALVGTASLRRTCQLHARYPKLRIQTLRGNVNSRLKRLDDGEFDAIILAAAGLIRLDYTARIAEFLAPEQHLPAAGQGAMGIECRLDDKTTLERVKLLDHPPTHCCITAERAVLEQLSGGCQVPIAAFATLHDHQLTLRGMVGKPDGSVILRAADSARYDAAQRLGEKVGQMLLAEGAQTILQELKH